MPSLRDELRAYESGVGARSGRLAVTIDSGRVSRLGCTAKGMKRYLMGLCFFLCCTAIIILATASYAKDANDAVAAFGSDVSNGILAVGALFLIIGALGLCGAMNENRLVLWIFCLVLGMFFLVLLIISAYLISLKGQEARLITRVWQYSSNDILWHIEQAYVCCGANFVNQLPAQPCPDPNLGPCVPLIVPDLRKAWLGFGVTGLLLSFVVLSGVLSACCLLSGITASSDQRKKITQKSQV